MLGNLISISIGLFALAVYLALGSYPEFHVWSWILYYTLIIFILLIVNQISKWPISISMIVIPLLTWSYFVIGLRVITGRLLDTDGMFFSIGIATWHTAIFFVARHLDKSVSSWSKQ